MPKIRNIYLGKDKIEQPTVGSQKMTAVYLGPTMVWGDIPAKVYVLNRISSNATYVKIYDISSSYLSYTYTTLSNFTANSNYTNLTDNAQITDIQFAVNDLSCKWPFLYCYLCEYTETPLSLPPSTYIDKIRLENNAFGSAILTENIKYASSITDDDIIELEHLHENDYVFCFEKPKLAFKVNNVVLNNKYTDVTYTSTNYLPTLADLKINSNTCISSAITFPPNNNSFKKPSITSVNASAYITIYAKISVKPNYVISGKSNGNCHVYIHLCDSAYNRISTQVEKIANISLNSGTTYITIQGNCVLQNEVSPSSNIKYLYIQVLATGAEIATPGTPVITPPTV